MKIHRKGKEIPPFKLEKATIRTSHLQDGSVTAAKLAGGFVSTLTELAATPAVDDELYIRDISEATADESKRITVANLMAAAGAATKTIATTNVYNAAAPTSWTALDISTPVGANEALVILKVLAPNARAYAVRTNGDTDEFYAAIDTPSGMALVEGQTGIYMLMFVITDSSGVIEHKCESSDNLTVDVIAYLK